MGELAQKGVAQTVNPLEMLEQEDETLQMCGLELAVDTVEGMSDGMGDLAGVKVALKGENVVANDDNIGVLLLGDAPNEEMNLARILRKIRRNLLAYERVRQIRDRQAPVDGVVVGDGHVIHPLFRELTMKLPWIR